MLGGSSIGAAVVSTLVGDVAGLLIGTAIAGVLLVLASIVLARAHAAS